MIVVLSQKVDSESTYEDELFKRYHYPARYRNQLHEGDIFVYYQGNRHDKSQRYYFGVGRVGKISEIDDNNFYADLLECQRFQVNMPIYLPDGGYIEQMDYDTVRKSINPPWQSSVRPLSQKAFSYILKSSGSTFGVSDSASLDELKENLKRAVRDFYVEKDESAILRVERISAAIAVKLGMKQKNSDFIVDISQEQRKSKTDEIPEAKKLIKYCETMRMSYSYKPILILALLHFGEESGEIAISDAVNYFKEYFEKRKMQGRSVEKRPCIYENEDITEKQIEANIVSNPVKALCKSGFFGYDTSEKIFYVRSELWNMLTKKDKIHLFGICKQRLRDYYLEIGNHRTR